MTKEELIELYSKTDSGALKRLIEEVQAGKPASTRYNRVYSRHNRS